MEINANECAAVQLQEPVNGCGADCGCPHMHRQDGLRAIRLYHYEAMVRLNRYADDADMRKSDSDHYRKRARYHLGHVQFLNDFFEIGDNAEQDASK